MHLMDALALRPVPAAAVFLSLTRRCPLTCAHCSTDSLMSSEEHAEELFLRFVETFTPDNRPQILILTGGEALLRPRLVADLITRAHAVGTRVNLISGMFFARHPRVPAPIRDAIAEVDLFTASLDVYHEQQVPRAAVFRVMRELVERGQEVSFQVVGRDEHDPYLAEVTADIRQAFADRVPALVTPLGPVGRARDWLEPREPYVDTAPLPCAVAAWPVVTFDGTVVGCCNQDVVDGQVPPHLRLGHVAVDGWGTVRRRYLASTMMRAIRVLGPEAIVDRYGSGKVACDGYCSTCLRLSDDPQIAERLEPVLARPAMRLMEEQVQAIQQRQLVWSMPAYAHMLTLGYAPQRRPACVG